MYDTSRGPYNAILDKMAQARQSVTGESYAKAFTEVYTDPANVALRDGAQYDHIAKAMDATHGTKLSLIPVAKAAPLPDPLQKAAEAAKLLGPAHAKMHSSAIDLQRRNPRLSYEAAYSRVYTDPSLAGLRENVRNEHLAASMAAVNGHGLGKAVAPPDPSQDYVSPGPANDKLNELE